MMPDFAERDGSGDAHGLAKSVAADFHHAEAVDLADARCRSVSMKQQVLLDHFADFGFDQVVPLDFGFAARCARARR